MIGPDLKGASILIIDDDDLIIRMLERLLRQQGFTAVLGTTRPEEGLAYYAANEVDLVILDFSMPGMNGIQVLDRLQRATPEGDYVPCLMLTGNASPDVRNQALSSGARDFLSKPFDKEEALLRIRNLLDTRRLHQALARHNETLEARVRERTRELEEAQLEILTRLALVAEHYDDDTSEHTHRVAWLAERIARELDIPEPDAALLGRAALLHDVGKIAVPASLTRKPGRLDAEERQLMQAHALAGAQLLGGSRLPLLQLAEEIARSHHEHWDGNGYPRGLSGEEIPLSGRIVAVADVYDALTHVRPYKDAWSSQRALLELRAGAGRQFDGRVVMALERVVARRRARGSAQPPVARTASA
jgi:putative two-component system response regulator